MFSCVRSTRIIYAERMNKKCLRTRVRKHTIRIENHTPTHKRRHNFAHIGFTVASRGDISIPLRTLSVESCVCAFGGTLYCSEGCIVLLASRASTYKYFDILNSFVLSILRMGSVHLLETKFWHVLIGIVSVGRPKPFKSTTVSLEENSR